MLGFVLNRQDIKREPTPSRSKYKGLALIFSPFDAARKLRQTLAAVYSDGAGSPLEAEKILEDARATVVTSNWLPTGSKASMSSTQANEVVVCWDVCFLRIKSGMLKHWECFFGCDEVDLFPGFNKF